MKDGIHLIQSFELLVNRHQSSMRMAINVSLILYFVAVFRNIAETHMVYMRLFPIKIRHRLFDITRVTDNSLKQSYLTFNSKSSTFREIMFGLITEPINI